jgi:endonuclease/exonuclease/phosphatase family metal-dependent hydrolase
MCWILIIKIISGFKNGIYGVIYKSPKQKNKQFLQILDDLLEESIIPTNLNIITGDFNYDLSKSSDYGEKLLIIFAQNNLKQIINDYTRETKNSKTLIDYVLTNDEVSYKILKNDKISDHNTVELCINKNINYVADNIKKIFLNIQE